MEETIKEISRKLPRSWVWTSSLETAISEATPNKGLKGKLSLIERRLLRKGHSNLVTNHTGIVLSYTTTAIPIGELTPTNTSDEYFIHFEQKSSWTVQAAHMPARKVQLLCPTLSPKPQPALSKIIDSNLWVAILTNTDTANAVANSLQLKGPISSTKSHHTSNNISLDKREGDVLPKNHLPT